MKRLLIVIACSALAAGCTHVQLRNDTVNESAAIGDVVTQEVMNNLAMFVYDPNSIPYFSFPNQGSSNVTDSGSANASAGWGRPITGAGTKHSTDFLLSALGIGGTASRSDLEGLTMTPVLDPRKLELMRCAYQIAVSSCGGPAMSQNCPDCQARLNNFYTGDPNGDLAKKAAGGTVTSNCLAGPKGPCWFHTGTKKCLPKHCDCLYVGEYCGTYVWVDHDGRNELAKLTFAILDYAINSAPVRATKTVSYNIDQFGLPANRNTAVGTVSASVGVDEQPVSLLNIPEADAARIEQILLQRYANFQQAYQQALVRQNPNEIKQAAADLDDVRMKLDFLKEQLRAGALKNQFLPGAPQQTPSGLLQLQLYQNTLLPQPQ